MNIKPYPHYPFFSKPPTPSHKKNAANFDSNSFNRSFEPVRILPSSQMRQKKKSSDRSYKTQCLGNSPQTTQRKRDFGQNSHFNLHLLNSQQAFAKDQGPIRNKKYFGERQRKQNIMNIASQKSSVMTFRQNQTGFYTPRNNISHPNSSKAEWENPSRENRNFELNKEEKISELQSILSEEISHRLEEIESIMDEENVNLRQHNEYLIDGIRKLQIEDRKNKTKIVELEKQVRVLSQKNTAYCKRIEEMERALDQKEGFSVERGIFQKKNSMSQKYFTSNIAENREKTQLKVFYPTKCMNKNRVHTFEQEQSLTISQDQNFTLQSFIANERSQEEQPENHQHPKNERKNTPCFLNNFEQQDFSKQLSKQYEIEPIANLKIRRQIFSETDEEVQSTEQSIMEGLQFELQKYLSIYKETLSQEAKQKCLNLMKKIKALKKTNPANPTIMRSKFNHQKAFNALVHDLKGIEIFSFALTYKF